MIAQQLIKHTAELHWRDRDGWGHVETHSAWSAARAVDMAWRRARSMMVSGQATAYTTRHTEEVIGVQ